MLVLTRKIQERIHIGDNITISILKLKGNTVRIGIEAPRDVRVLRGELPTFDGTFEGETASSKAVASESVGSIGGGSDSGASNSPHADSGSEQAEEEATVSELEWEVLKRIASRRKPCLSVRRCAPQEKVDARSTSVARAASVAASTVGVSE